MVHKKYTYKDGKRFGPYYYETKRVDGNVVTTYLGTKLPHKKIHLSLIKNVLLVFAFILLIVSAYFISSNITGNVSLDIKTNYDLGEPISGKLELNLLEGELIPANSMVLVEYGNISKEFILSDLVLDDLSDGDFYVQGKSISGKGLGYGLAGKIVTYPSVNFDFYLSETGSSGSPEQNTQEKEESDSQGGELVSEDVNGENLEESNAQSPEAQSPEVQSSESIDTSITGAVISDSNIISGVVSKEQDFTYSLLDGQTASLVEGSVSSEGTSLEDNVIEFDLNSNEILVTTDYFIEREGFGQDYIGDNSKNLVLNLDSFELIANTESDIKISLVYDSNILVEASEFITLSNTEALNSSEINENQEGVSGVSEVVNEPILNETIVNQTTINETINQTNFNQTIVNQTQIENVTALNETLVNGTLIDVKITQYNAVIGQPVRWVKTISLDLNDSLNLTVEIPASADNVTVNKITGPETLEESIVEVPENSEEFDSDLVVGITGEVTADLDLGRESIFSKIFKFFRITGRAIEDEVETQEISVELLEEDLGIEVEYYTGAPIAIENIVNDNFKEVLVSSPEDIHYENVLVYTNILDSSKIRNISSVRVEWVENDSLLNVSFYNDTNLDGYIDYIEWVAPHLSNQTFNIILIISALHLDENRNFVSDIYNETRELDGYWSESIPEGHYVRVTFEKNLTNENDITIFPRASSGDNISEINIEIFEKDSNLSIAQFSNLIENEYNKIFLLNLNNSQDTFDLLINGGNIEFDYITDPTVRLNGPAGDIDIIPIDEVTFVVAWINATGNLTQFSVMNPNGTTVVGPVTVGTSVGVYSRVGLATINQTKFAIGWVNQSTGDDLNQIYNITGSALTNQYFFDGAIGNNRYDIGLANLGDRYGYCYVDQAEGDVDFIDFFQNGSRVTGHNELDVDTAAAPENNRMNVVDCVGINSTTYGLAWYDAGTADDILFRTINSSGSSLNISGANSIDTAVSNFGQVAMSNLDNNRTVIAFYDQADQDITITIRGASNQTLLAPTDIEVNAGNMSSVEVVTLTNGTSTTRDYFVVIWYNKSTESIVARPYYGNITPTRGQFTIESFAQSLANSSLTANSTYPIFSAAGKDPITGQSLCSGGFVVGYVNRTNSTVLKSYWINGTEWDGTCVIPVVYYPNFFNFNETVANNSAYLINNVYRFNVSINNSNGTAGIEFNGVNFSATNLTSNMFNRTISNLGAGTYSYYWWSYSTTSTYNKSANFNYVVSRNSSAAPILKLNNSQSNIFILNNTSVLLNATIGVGDPGATLSLHVNGSAIGQRAIEISNSTNFGNVSYIYNVTAIYLQSQNYTQSSTRYDSAVLPGPYKSIYLVDAPQSFSFSSDTYDQPVGIVSEGANFLVLQLAILGGALPHDVTYDGSGMQRVGTGSFSENSNFDAEIYYLENPSICGGCRLIINLDSSADAEFSFFSLANVNLTHPLENFSYTTNVNVENITTNITTYAYRSWLVDTLMLESSGASPGVNITKTLEGSLIDAYGGYKANVTPWQNSMSWNWTTSKEIAHIVASFRPYFDTDLLPPDVTLNSPANFATFNLSNPVNFNWTATDDWDNSLLCNITLNGITNASNIVSPNATATNFTVTGINVGTYNWYVSCIDDAQNAGASSSRSLKILNAPPSNSSIVVLNSTLGTNKTLEDLNVGTTLFDLNNHTMNVTVRWYNNSVLHLTQMYNNSYANGTTFIATLGNGNTTLNENWFVNLTINDGFNSTVIKSTNVTILETNPTITLLTPLNNSINVNYTNQNFTWDADDADSPQFVAAVSINVSSLAASSCDDPVFNGSTTYLIYLDVVPAPESYFLTTPLQLECPSYVWSAIGFSTTLGEWSVPFRFNVTGNSPIVALNYSPNASVFSTSSPIEFNWTVYDNNAIYCNLLIDDLVYVSGIGSISGQMANASVSGLSSGAHYWNVSCLDAYYNSGDSITRTIFVNDGPYNGTSLAINSTLGLNKTLEDLNVRTTILDKDNNLMNVTVRWYNNSILHLTQMYNNSYANGTTFIATLGNGNTTRGQNWTAQLSLNDGTGQFSVNSSNLTILNTAPVVSLISPLHIAGVGYFGFNLTNQTYLWNVTDDDNDIILNFTFTHFYSLFLQGTYCTDNFWQPSSFDTGTEITLGNLTSYNLTAIPADCEGSYYWNVKAYDGIENGSYPSINAANYLFNSRPNVTLVAPPNNTAYSLGSSISFNWTVNETTTVVSNLNLVGCALVIDGVNNVTITNLYGNNTPINQTVSGFSSGVHNWSVACLSSFDEIYQTNLIGNSETRIFTIGSGPYNITPVIINSTLGLNGTLENLNVRTTIFDQDNNSMNLTVRWYNNSVLHLTQMYNNSYANGTAFIATLGNGNTTRGQNWSAQLSLNDGTGQFSVNSSNLTILNTLPNITLISPVNGSFTLNRTNQRFVWATSDPDGDVISVFSVNISLIASSTCVDSNYAGDSSFGMGSGGSILDFGYGPLNCLIDNGDYYMWSVSGKDSFTGEYSRYYGYFNLSVQAYLNFVMNLSSVDFGNLAYLKSNDTSDNSPKPIIIINEGNVKANFTMGASSLWSSVSNPSAYYTAKVDNATTNGISENGTFVSSSSTILYTPVPLTSSPMSLARGFGYQDNLDTIEVDINATVPNTEGPGLKNSTVTFTFVLSDQEIYV